MFDLCWTETLKMKIRLEIDQRDFESNDFSRETSILTQCYRLNEFFSMLDFSFKQAGLTLIAY